MVTHQDVVSGDEMCSDSNPIKIVDDVIFEIMCNMIVVRTNEPDPDGECTSTLEKKFLWLIFLLVAKFYLFILADLCFFF